VLRNPLASPFTLGVSSGGAFGAVLAIRLGLDALCGHVAIPTCAFAGALATVLLVYRIARIGPSSAPGHAPPRRVTMSFVWARRHVVQYTADYSQLYGWWDG